MPSLGGKFDGNWLDGYAQNARFRFIEAMIKHLVAAMGLVRKEHGRGVWRGKDGGMYDGEWRCGKKHGVGVRTYELLEK